MTVYRANSSTSWRFGEQDQIFSICGKLTGNLTWKEEDYLRCLSGELLHFCELFSEAEGSQDRFAAREGAGMLPQLGLLRALLCSALWAGTGRWKIQPSVRLHSLSFGTWEDLEGRQDDESHEFSFSMGFSSWRPCDMKHFLTTGEQQSLLWLRWKLIFVFQVQLDSFLHLLTGARGKIDLISLPAYHLELDWNLNSGCGWILAGWFLWKACMSHFNFSSFKNVFPLDSSFFSHLK